MLARAAARILRKFSQMLAAAGRTAAASYFTGGLSGF